MPQPEHRFDKIYPDWLAWTALLSFALALTGVGVAIYAALAIHSAALGLAGATMLFLGLVTFYLVLVKAEAFLKTPHRGNGHAAA